ncbi:hypothetical protein Hanom_Chr13g01186951 [Helianthus anomalus]
MPSFYPGQHVPLPILEPGTSGKRWLSVANWATPIGLFHCVIVCCDVHCVLRIWILDFFSILWQ